MKPKVLLVEAAKIQRLYLQQHLKEDDYEILEAVDGVSAITEIAQNSPDVVVISWELQDMEGIELISKYVADESLLIPFIMLTSHPEPARVMTALNSGAFDFLHKPAQPLELRARVKSALRFRSLQKKFLDLAIRDTLTGQYNRRYLESQMSTMLPESEKQEQTLGFAMCDIDFFKKVNDTYGHDVGDIVIKQMASLLNSSIRDTDFAARIGGEEFVVVLPGLDAPECKEVMQRILEKAHTKTWGERDNPIKITFSCGISTAALGGYDLEKILKLADEGLYHAKQNGRNQVVEPIQLTQTAKAI